jgi:hypothetical protein
MGGIGLRLPSFTTLWCDKRPDSRAGIHLYIS